MKMLRQQAKAKGKGSFPFLPKRAKGYLLSAAEPKRRDLEFIGSEIATVSRKWRYLCPLMATLSIFIPLLPSS